MSEWTWILRSPHRHHNRAMTQCKYCDNGCQHFPRLKICCSMMIKKIRKIHKYVKSSWDTYTDKRQNIYLYNNIYAGGKCGCIQIGPIEIIFFFAIPIIFLLDHIIIVFAVFPRFTLKLLHRRKYDNFVKNANYVNCITNYHRKKYYATANR